MKEQLSLRIIEVENGYIVSEDDVGRRMELQPNWVATSIPELLEVVSTLATKARIQAKEAQACKD